MMLDLLSWPLQSLGGWLRGLSLSGSTGNAAALILYLCIGLLPMGCLAAAALRKCRLRIEDVAAAVLLSALLLWSIYAAINPQTAGILAQLPETSPVVWALLSGACLSMAIAWAVLKLVRLLMSGTDRDLLRWSRPVLAVAAIAFAVSGLYAGVTGAVQTLSGITDGNTDGVLPLTLTMLILQSLTLLSADLVTAWCLLRATALIGTMKDFTPTDATLTAAHRLSRLCGGGLAFSVCAAAVLNGAASLLLPYLQRADVQVQLPLEAMCMLLLVLVLCRLLQRNKQLSDENDLFV